MTMKRFQILLDEELDAELDRTSARTGRSKAAVIREVLRERLRPLPPLSADPLWQMAGRDAFEPAHVDDVVYGGTQVAHRVRREKAKRTSRRSR